MSFSGTLKEVAKKLGQAGLEIAKASRKSLFVILAVATTACLFGGAAILSPFLFLGFLAVGRSISRSEQIDRGIIPPKSKLVSLLENLLIPKSLRKPLPPVQIKNPAPPVNGEKSSFKAPPSPQDAFKLAAANEKIAQLRQEVDYARQQGYHPRNFNI